MKYTIITLIAAASLTSCVTHTTTVSRTVNRTTVNRTSFVNVPQKSVTWKTGVRSVVVINPENNTAKTVNMTPEQYKQYVESINRYEARQQAARNNQMRQGMPSRITENAVEDIGLTYGRNTQQAKPQQPPMNALQQAYYNQTGIYVAPVGR